MKNNRRHENEAFVLVLLLSLMSCAVKPSVTEPVLSLTSTPLKQVTLTAVSIVSTNAVLPTSLPTMSGIETLSPENASIELENLLKNDCGLSCFAGITPGETLLIDASRTFLPFSSVSDWNSLSERGGQFGINYPKGNIILNLFFEIYSLKSENYVQFLHVFTEALRKIEGGYEWVYDANPYHEILALYSLQNVFATYGKPSEIYVTVEINEAEYDSPDFVLLWLLYPEKGFIAKYTANAEVVDGIVRGCPSKAFVELWFFNPYENDSYKEDLLLFDETLGYVLPIPSIRTKPISDGLDMSLDEFYQKFSRSSNQCLEAPESIWAK